MKILIHVIVVMVFASIYVGCSTEKYCTRFADCKKKYSITFTIISDSISGSELAGELDNQSGKALKLNDSLKVLFYKYNQNLNTPFHDSVYKSTDSIIDFVEQSGEVVLLSMFFKESIEIRSGSKYIFKINKLNLEKIVFSDGSPDNRYQLENGFQLFVTSVTQGNKKIHFASNIFTL